MNNQEKLELQTLIESIEDSVLGLNGYIRELKDKLFFDKVEIRMVGKVPEQSLSLKPTHDTSFEDNRKELLKEVDFILREKIEKKAPKPLWQKVCNWANDKFKYSYPKDKVNVWEYLWTRVSRLSNEEMKEFVDMMKE